MRARITEHTTTDDTYCEVENLDTGETGEFNGSIDVFTEQFPNVVIEEEVWS
jgi:hypothetical protein